MMRLRWRGGKLSRAKECVQDEEDDDEEPEHMKYPRNKRQIYWNAFVLWWMQWRRVKNMRSLFYINNQQIVYELYENLLWVCLCVFFLLAFGSKVQFFVPSFFLSFQCNSRCIYMCGKRLIWCYHKRFKEKNERKKHTIQHWQLQCESGCKWIKMRCEWKKTHRNMLEIYIEHKYPGSRVPVINFFYPPYSCLCFL